MCVCARLGLSVFMCLCCLVWFGLIWCCFVCWFVRVSWRGACQREGHKDHGNLDGKAGPIPSASQVASKSEGSALYEAPFGLYRLAVDTGKGEETLEAEAVLNATGRKTRTEGLDLHKAGICCNGAELVVDEQLRTTNPDIFGAGDVLPDRQRFTHAAEWQARLAVRNALLGERLDARRLLIPRATYTEPEVAAVGSTAEELKAAGVKFETFVRQAADVDRNRCDGVTEGFASLHVAQDGQILGACVVGPNAGDHISEVTLCMQHGLTASDLAGTMHPYPTAAEVVRQAAQAFVRAQIFRAANQDLLRGSSDPCNAVRAECSELGLCTISIDRPEALNACDQAMAKCIVEAARLPHARALLLQGAQAGQRGKVAFCAGGDVKAMAQVLKEDPQSQLPAVQLAQEYAAISSLSRRRAEGLPVICFMDGICMGFGLGLACACEFRVVTERSLLAMPECAIGITPDVGFAAMAATMAAGRCMALTGWRLTGSEAVAYGLATHLVPSEKLESLRRKLQELDFSSGEEVSRILDEYDDEESRQQDGAILSVLDSVFTQSPTAKEAARQLKALGKDTSIDPRVREWVKEREKGFGQGCPLTQEVILRLLEIAEFAARRPGADRHQLLIASLERDFAAVSRLLVAPDFSEGVRAALIDKDKQPAWTASLEDVDPAEVYKLIAPLPDSQKVAFDG
ncbi:unnamed protein product [Effrenium voratum]|nr:unnamed protein product [Effrenium voratum]